jgi:hypothetical protein
LLGSFAADFKPQIWGNHGCDWRTKSFWGGGGGVGGDMKLRLSLLWRSNQSPTPKPWCLSATPDNCASQRTPLWQRHKMQSVSRRFSQNCEKPTISFVASVCPSVRMEKVGTHWTDFSEIWYLRIFRKPVDKTQVSLKSDENRGCFTWRPIYVFFNLISLISS